MATPGAGLPGFRAPILAAAALAAAASVWAACALRETRPADSGVRPTIHYGEAFRYVGSHTLLLRLFVIAFCAIAAFSSMEAVFGLWTQRNFGWTSRHVGLAFLFIGGAGLFVQSLLIGPLVKRFGEARIIVGGLTLLFLSILLQPVLRLPQASVLLMALLMAGHSLTFPNVGALVSRTTPPERQGSVMGLNMASNAGSRIIAPIFFGWIFGHNADAPYYGCALVVLAMLPVAWRVVSIRDREALA